MTTATDPGPHDTHRRADVLARAAGLGLALGWLDLVLIHVLPYPLADLANSSAVWALAAFALGRSLRRDRGLDIGTCAAAGAVLLVVGVEAYDLAAVLVNLSAPAVLVTATTVLWCVLGVVAGGVFGAAGGWSLDRRPWCAAAAVGLVVGVLLAEAWLRRGLADTAAVTVLVALVVIGACVRSPIALARTAAVVVPAVLLCLAGFALAGF